MLESKDRDVQGEAPVSVQHHGRVGVPRRNARRRWPPRATSPPWREPGPRASPATAGRRPRPSSPSRGGSGFDTSGRLYIADSGNQKTRRIAHLGHDQHLRGQRGRRVLRRRRAGDGGPACQHRALLLRAADTVYISDFGNNRVRRVDAAGHDHHFRWRRDRRVRRRQRPGHLGLAEPAPLGRRRRRGQPVHRRLRQQPGAKGHPLGDDHDLRGQRNRRLAGDGGPATDAELDYPVGLALDGAGNLYIADAGSHRVRRVNSAGTITRWPAPAPPARPATAAQRPTPSSTGPTGSRWTAPAAFHRGLRRQPGAQGELRGDDHHLRRHRHRRLGRRQRPGDGRPAQLPARADPRYAPATSTSPTPATSGCGRSPSRSRPNTTIDSGPAGTINDSDPDLRLLLLGGRARASSAGSTRGRSRPAARRTPRRARRRRPHLLDVRATDPAGNVDPTPGAALVHRRRRRRPTRRSTPVPRGHQRPDPDLRLLLLGGRLELRVQGRRRGRSRPARSPQTTAQLADGAHTFSVRATDPAGNVDPTPGPSVVHGRHLAAADDDQLRALGDDQRPDPDLRLLLLGGRLELRVQGRLRLLFGLQTRRRPRRSWPTARTPSRSGPPIRSATSIRRPAQRSFTVDTASVSISGSTLEDQRGGGGRRIYLEITRHSDRTLLVTDLASGAYSGSGVHAGAGCTQRRRQRGSLRRRRGQAGRGQGRRRADKVTNSTPLESDLSGGSADDKLIGGSIWTP